MNLKALFTALLHTQVMTMRRYPAIRPSTRTSSSSRGSGLFLGVLAALAMLWDVKLMMVGQSLVGLSGFSDIWTHLNASSFAALQNLIFQLLGPQVWNTSFSPILNAPAAAVFGMPALLLLLSSKRELTLRAPSPYESEMQIMGVSPRHRGNRRAY